MPFLFCCNKTSAVAAVTPPRRAPAPVDPRHRSNDDQPDDDPEEQEPEEVPARTSSFQQQGSFAYFCFICMQYYEKADAYKSMCCRQYVCHDCCVDYASLPASQPVVQEGQDSRDCEIECPYCRRPVFTLERIQAGDLPSAKTPAPHASPGFRHRKGLPSPLKVGDDFAALRRKLIGFEEEGYRIPGSISSPKKASMERSLRLPERNQEEEDVGPSSKSDGVLPLPPLMRGIASQENDFDEDEEDEDGRDADQEDEREQSGSPRGLGGSFPVVAQLAPLAVPRRVNE